jgi:nucleotide-binding universal stress UspA family protein
MTASLPSVLCPIDFSEPSRSALCYASAVADHFGVRLTLLAVDDPLLAATSLGLEPPLGETTLAELKRFCCDTLPGWQSSPKRIEFRVTVGKPAPEILREAKEQHADVIVMGAHGRGGVGKIVFGSTTERVLRETSVAVLVPPDAMPPATSLSEIARHINCILAPVDLTAPSSQQTIRVASGLAEAISVPLAVGHVLEPISLGYASGLAISSAEEKRRAEAEQSLARLTAAIGPHVRVRSVVVAGDPSDRIVAMSEDHEANLIVMGLHSSGLLGPRMGSVTYRVLRRTNALVLALPPQAVNSGATAVERSAPHTVSLL